MKLWHLIALFVIVAIIGMAVYWAIYNGEVLDPGKEEAEKNVADIISQYCMETQEKSIKPINDNVALGWEYK